LYKNDNVSNNRCDRYSNVKSFGGVFEKCELTTERSIVRNWNCTGDFIYFLSTC